MARDRGPEEFFEVFREVQASKKQAEDEETAHAGALAAQAAEPEAPVRQRRALPDALEVSYPVAAAFVVGALLLIVAAYLLGKQRGYALAAAPARPVVAGPTTQTPGHVPAGSGPEIVDGKIFRLLYSGAAARDRDSVETEVEYLNSYEDFRALGVRAYPWRDATRHYWLCARGFADKPAAERDRIKSRIRALRSSRGRKEYDGADFFKP